MCQALRKHFQVLNKVMELPFSSTFGEAYFYLFDFESNIEFDEDLEHLVGVNEGGHLNVANVGQRNI